jgi:hypothetical protein
MASIDRDTLLAFARGRLSREDSMRILEAIERDQTLSKELEEILLLMRAADDEPSERHDEQKTLFFEPALKYVLRIAAVLVLGVLSLAALSEVTKAKHHDLARVEDINFNSQWRGMSNEDVDIGRTLFLAGEHDAAIVHLERIARAIPPDESACVVHWMIGAMLLETAEGSTVGLFPSYDSARVRRALDHLGIAFHSSNSRLIEDTQLLRMKAFLMLEFPQEAVHEGESYLKTESVERSAVIDLLKRIDRR